MSAAADDRVVVEKEVARFRGTEILRPPALKKPRTLVVPQNLELTDVNREAFARYEAPYAVDTLLRRTKDVRSLGREFLVALDQPHLVRWIRAQEAFLKTLTPREMWVVKTYTKHGDRMVNGWARGTLPVVIDDLMRASVAWSAIPFQYSMYDQYDAIVRAGVPLPPRASWLDAKGVLRREVVAEIVRDNLSYFGISANLGSLLKQYMAEILAVMRRAPRLIGDVVTYRGFKSEAHLKGLKYVAREFGSTSVNPAVALAFAESNTVGSHTVFCCLYELTVKAGVPCLYLGSLTEFDDEFEILLPPGATYRLGKEILVKRVMPEGKSLTEVLADPPKTEAMVVEGTVSWVERDWRRSGTRRSSGWVREELIHVPRRKKPGKGRRFKTARAGAGVSSSSEGMERISELLTESSRSRSAGGTSE